MRRHWMIAGILGGIAAVLFFFSMAGYAFPGESARLLAVWKGLDASADVVHPVMAVFAKLLGGGNLIAPCCGVVAVVALFLVIRAFVAWCVRGEDVDEKREILSCSAASVASAVFMLSPAVRSAATHLEPRMFEVTLALVSVAISMPFFSVRSLPAGLFPLVLGVMVALGLCESSLAAALLPFYLALVTAVAIRRKRNLYLAGFVFVLVLFVSLSVFANVLGIGFAKCLQRVAHGVSGYRLVPGWVPVFVFATLPFVLSMLASVKSFAEKPSFAMLVFHSAMTLSAILSLATPLSPSSLMEPYGILPVASCMFVASSTGYLAAYWWNLRRSRTGIVMGGALAFVVIVCCGWNLFTFDGTAGEFADRMARKILDDLGDRRWFVSDGTLDDNLMLAASAAGRELHVISLSRDHDGEYLARLSKEVEDAKLGGERNAELRLSLSLGVLPFVQDWFKCDPSVEKTVAVFGAPDLWYAAGITPVPEFVFFGADPAKVPDWDEWKEFDNVLFAPKGWGSYRDRGATNPAERMRLALRRHVGMVANNRGVYLQDQHRDDDAWKMYELVLNSIDHDNICSIFNEVEMIGEKHPSAIAKRRDLERMIKAAVDDQSRRYLLWRLGAYYGYIRNPDIFIRLGHAWAKSGRPGDAIAQIRRAIDFVPSDRQSVLMNMMASLYANENDQKKSRGIYEAVLSRNSNDHDALVGMMRLELLDGNSSKAIEYLQRAADVGGDGTQAKTELALVAMMRGEFVKAGDLLRKVIDADSKNMQAWSLLSAVTIQRIDASKDAKERAKLEQELERSILPSMEKLATNQFDYYLQTTRGFLLLRKGAEKRKEARAAFMNAARSRPDVAAAQDIVLGLDISLDDKAGAEAHARDVLRRNRSAPLANYVMGSLALQKGNDDEAGVYLRRAAEAPQPVALALNDYAELLRRQRKYDEAERYARKAVKTAPGLYVAWETLGSVLMDANRALDEAEAAVRKACDLSKGKNGREADIRMLVSLARVQIRGGERERAKITVRKVMARIDELNDFERKEFEEVRKTMK